MHRELLELLDRAKVRANAESERAFARALALDPSTLLGYRRGKCWPDDDRMARICRLAGVPVPEGLLRLNIWRSHGDVRRTYGDLLKKLGQ
jgi:transcriptional regulator with XRE-family HTH domain